MECTGVTPLDSTASGTDSIYSNVQLQQHNSREGELLQREAFKCFSREYGKRHNYDYQQDIYTDTGEYLATLAKASNETIIACVIIA